MKHEKQIQDRRARRKGEKEAERRQELSARRHRVMQAAVIVKPKLPLAAIWTWIGFRAQRTMG